MKKLLSLLLALALALGLCAPGLAEETKAGAEQAARALGVRQIHWVKTGGVITTHGGPGAFGVVGFTR